MLGLSNHTSGDSQETHALWLLGTTPQGSVITCQESSTNALYWLGLKIRALLFTLRYRDIIVC